MAYLAVWLERSRGNGYACIIDQDQVFKHLSKSDSEAIKVIVKEICCLEETTLESDVFKSLCSAPKTMNSLYKRKSSGKSV